MKTVLKDACIKCGSNVWYVHRSGRRCVPCAHNRALTGRAKIKALEIEVEQLREANEAFGKRQDWWAERMFELEEAVRGEREACAALIEKVAKSDLITRDDFTHYICKDTAEALAMCIRNKDVFVWPPRDGGDA